MLFIDGKQEFFKVYLPATIDLLLMRIHTKKIIKGLYAQIFECSHEERKNRFINQDPLIQGKPLKKSSFAFPAQVSNFYNKTLNNKVTNNT